MSAQEIVHKCVENMNNDGAPVFHLRRIGPTATKPGVANIMDFDKVTSLIGRNHGSVDFLLDSSNPVSSQYISRLHARVVRQDQNLHRLFDDSLNGIFLNNTKICGSVVLQEGDVLTFGHPHGARLAAGVWKRQPDSEYQFMFEKCSCRSNKKIRSSILEDKVNIVPVAVFKEPQGVAKKTTKLNANAVSSANEILDKCITTMSNLAECLGSSPKVFKALKQATALAPTDAKSIPAECEEVKTPSVGHMDLSDRHAEENKSTLYSENQPSATEEGHVQKQRRITDFFQLPHMSERKVEPDSMCEDTFVTELSASDTSIPESGTFKEMVESMCSNNHSAITSLESSNPDVISRPQPASCLKENSTQQTTSMISSTLGHSESAVVRLDHTPMAAAINPDSLADLTANYQPPVDTATICESSVKTIIESEPPIESTSSPDPLIEDNDNYEPPPRAPTDSELPIEATSNSELHGKVSATKCLLSIETTSNFEAPMESITNSELPVEATSNIELPMEATSNIELPMEATSNTELLVEAASKTKLPEEATSNSELSKEAASSTELSVEAVSNTELSTELSVEAASSTELSVETVSNTELSTELSVEAASNTELFVEAASDTELSVEAASNTELFVEAASDTELSVEAASNTELSVEAASNTELSVEAANNTKPVKAASNTELSVEAASNSELSVEAASNTELSVEAASNTELSVEAASNTELSVEAASNTELSVEAASNTKPVEAASNTELSVEAASNSELSVEAASSTELSVEAASNTELSVEAASNTELSVEAASNTELSVEAASNTELSVEAASNTELSVEAACNTELSVEAASNTELPAEANSSCELPVEATTNFKLPMESTTTSVLTVKTANNTEIHLDASTNSITVPAESAFNSELFLEANVNYQLPIEPRAHYDVPGETAAKSDLQVEAFISNCELQVAASATKSEPPMKSPTNSQHLEVSTNSELPLEISTNSKLLLETTTNFELPMEDTTNCEQPGEAKTSYELPVEVDTNCELPAITSELPLEATTSSLQPMIATTNSELALELLVEASANSELPVKVTHSSELPIEANTNYDQPGKAAVNCEKHVDTSATKLELPVESTINSEVLAEATNELPVEADTKCELLVDVTIDSKLQVVATTTSTGPPFVATTNFELPVELNINSELPIEANTNHGLPEGSVNSGLHVKASATKSELSVEATSDSQPPIETTTSFELQSTTNCEPPVKAVNNCKLSVEGITNLEPPFEANSTTELSTESATNSRLHEEATMNSEPPMEDKTNTELSVKVTTNCKSPVEATVVNNIPVDCSMVSKNTDAEGSRITSKTYLPLTVSISEPASTSGESRPYFVESNDCEHPVAIPSDRASSVASMLAGNMPAPCSESETSPRLVVEVMESVCSDFSENDSQEDFTLRSIGMKTTIEDILSIGSQKVDKKETYGGNAACLGVGEQVQQNYVRGFEPGTGVSEPEEPDRDTAKEMTEVGRTADDGTDVHTEVGKTADDGSDVHTKITEVGKTADDGSDVHTKITEVGKTADDGSDVHTEMTEVGRTADDGSDVHTEMTEVGRTADDGSDVHTEMTEVGRTADDGSDVHTEMTEVGRTVDDGSDVHTEMTEVGRTVDDGSDVHTKITEVGKTADDGSDVHTEMTEVGRTADDGSDVHTEMTEVGRTADDGSDVHTEMTEVGRTVDDGSDVHTEMTEVGRTVDDGSDVHTKITEVGKTADDGSDVHTEMTEVGRTADDGSDVHTEMTEVGRTADDGSDVYTEMTEVGRTADDGSDVHTEITEVNRTADDETDVHTKIIEVGRTVDDGSDVHINITEVGRTADDGSDVYTEMTEVGRTVDDGSDVHTEMTEVGRTADDGSDVYIEITEVGRTVDDGSDVHTEMTEVGRTADDGTDVHTEMTEVGRTVDDGSDVHTEFTEVGRTADDGSDVHTEMTEVGRTADDGSDVHTEMTEVGRTADDGSDVHTEMTEVNRTADDETDVHTKIIEVGRTADDETVHTKITEVGRTADDETDVHSKIIEVGRTVDDGSDVHTEMTEVGRTTDDGTDVHTEMTEVGRSTNDGTDVHTEMTEVGRTADDGSDVHTEMTEVGRAADDGSDVHTKRIEVGRTADDGSDVHTKRIEVGSTADDRTDVLTEMTGASCTEDDKNEMNVKSKTTNKLADFWSKGTCIDPINSNMVDYQLSDNEDSLCETNITGHDEKCGSSLGALDRTQTSSSVAQQDGKGQRSLSNILSEDATCENESDLRKLAELQETQDCSTFTTSTPNNEKVNDREANIEVDFISPVASHDELGSEACNEMEDNEENRETVTSYCDTESMYPNYSHDDTRSTMFSTEISPSGKGAHKEGEKRQCPASDTLDVTSCGLDASRSVGVNFSNTQRNKPASCHAMGSNCCEIEKDRTEETVDVPKSVGSMEAHCQAPSVLDDTLIQQEKTVVHTHCSSSSRHNSGDASLEATDHIRIADTHRDGVQGTLIMSSNDADHIKVGHLKATGKLREFAEVEDYEDLTLCAPQDGLQATQTSLNDDPSGAKDSDGTDGSSFHEEDADGIDSTQVVTNDELEGFSNTQVSVDGHEKTTGTVSHQVETSQDGYEWLIGTSTHSVKISEENDIDNEKDKNGPADMANDFKENSWNGESGMKKEEQFLHQEHVTDSPVGSEDSSGLYSCQMTVDESKLELGGEEIVVEESASVLHLVQGKLWHVRRMQDIIVNDEDISPSPDLFSQQLDSQEAFKGRISVGQNADPDRVTVTSDDDSSEVDEAPEEKEAYDRLKSTLDEVMGKSTHLLERLRSLGNHTTVIQTSSDEEKQNIHKIVPQTQFDTNSRTEQDMSVHNTQNIHKIDFLRSLELVSVPSGDGEASSTEDSPLTSSPVAPAILAFPQEKSALYEAPTELPFPERPETGNWASEIEVLSEIKYSEEDRPNSSLISVGTGGDSEEQGLFKSPLVVLSPSSYSERNYRNYSAELSTDDVQKANSEDNTPVTDESQSVVSEMSDFKEEDDVCLVWSEASGDRLPGMEDKEDFAFYGVPSSTVCSEQTEIRHKEEHRCISVSTGEAQNQTEEFASIASVVKNTEMNAKVGENNVLNYKRVDAMREVEIKEIEKEMGGENVNGKMSTDAAVNEVEVGGGYDLVGEIETGEVHDEKLLGNKSTVSSVEIGGAGGQVDDEEGGQIGNRLDIEIFGAVDVRKNKVGEVCATGLDEVCKTGIGEVVSESGVGEVGEIGSGEYRPTKIEVAEKVNEVRFHEIVSAVAGTTEAVSVRDTPGKEVGKNFEDREAKLGIVSNVSIDVEGGIDERESPRARRNKTTGIREPETASACEQLSDLRVQGWDQEPKEKSQSLSEAEPVNDSLNMSQDLSESGTKNSEISCGEVYSRETRAVSVVQDNIDSREVLIPESSLGAGISVVHIGAGLLEEESLVGQAITVDSSNKAVLQNREKNEQAIDITGNQMGEQRGSCDVAKENILPTIRRYDGESDADSKQEENNENLNDHTDIGKMHHSSERTLSKRKSDECLESSYTKMRRVEVIESQDMFDTVETQDALETDSSLNDNEKLIVGSGGTSSCYENPEVPHGYHQSDSENDCDENVTFDGPGKRKIISGRNCCQVASPIQIKKRKTLSPWKSNDNFKKCTDADTVCDKTINPLNTPSLVTTGKFSNVMSPLSTPKSDEPPALASPLELEPSPNEQSRITNISLSRCADKDNHQGFVPTPKVSTLEANVTSSSTSLLSSACSSTSVPEQRTQKTPEAQRARRRGKIESAVLKELIRLNREIRNFLNKDKPDVEQAISTLQDLEILPLNSQVLQRFPSVLDNVKKCQKYGHSEEVQNLARSIFTRFKMLIEHH